MSKPIILNKDNLPPKYEPKSARFKDISNKKFGKLTALYPCGKDNSNHIEWVCQCDCEEHNYIKIAQNKLKSGNTSSCGCLVGFKNKINSQKVQEDRIGKIFNNLEIIGLGDYAIKQDGRKDRLLKCKCLLCGSIKEVRAYDIISGKTKACGCTISLGNNFIKNYLTNNNIKFIDEYRITECKDTRPLPFDFAIFNNNNLLALIEYQGIQHFTYENHGWENEEKFEIIKKHDNIKYNYCKDNNIKLYYINYNDNKEQKLKEILNELFS